MARVKRQLGEILVSAGAVTPDQLRKVLEEQKKTSERLGQILIRLGMTTEQAIIESLEEQAAIPYVDMDTYLVDRRAIGLVPQSLARRHNIVPLFRIENTLTVAMANPLDIYALDELRAKLGLEIEPVISFENKIARAIDHYYGHLSPLKDSAEVISGGKEGAHVPERGESELDEGPAVKFVNTIITQAVRDGASDIHLEPDQTALQSRYRIDGVLHPGPLAPKPLQPSIISRVKVLAEMDIAESRAPQDGRFKMKVENKEIEFRVSAFPTIYGENVVLRLLDQSSALLGLEKLGFSQKTLNAFTKIIAIPHGIILVTGPTGSGKTTTLYASLNTINSVERNIVTIEDPVEYRLKLIRQTQINPRAGVTFANGLRSILRQDPDVIMVGEIRDRETAELAVQAALTGHLVFSTLHTNDTPGALTRLVDMGIEPFLVASSVSGILAQRLIRTICPYCKELYAPDPDELRQMNLGADALLARSKGCQNCKQTGYRGRIGLFELLAVDDDIRDLVTAKASASAIRRKARETQHMKSLREDGFDKVLQGITTLKEVNRVTFEGEFSVKPPSIA